MIYPPDGGRFLAARAAIVARQNQAILAEKLSWPGGALEACRELEDEFPGWHVAWLNENTITGFERPAGYCATLDGLHSVRLLAATPQELAELMRAVPPHDYSVNGCDWCLDRAEERLRRAGL